MCIWSISTVCVLNLNLQLGVLYLVNVLGQYLECIGFMFSASEFGLVYIYHVLSELGLHVYLQ